MNPILFNRADFPSDRTTFLPRPLDRTWHQIEVTGDHAAMLNKQRVTQVIDRTALEMIVDAYATAAATPHWTGLLIDADHLSHDLNHRTEAMGWLKNVEIRDDQLWGEVEWTDAGAAAVGNRRYQFFSTEYDAGDLTDLGAGRVRPGRLAGLALTNRPNNRGGRPISNRNGVSLSPEPNPTQPQNDDKPMKNIATQLGLPEEATEEEILGKIKALQESAGKAESMEAEVKAEEVLNRHARRIPAGKREDWKKELIANREGAERLLATLPEVVAEGAAQLGREPIYNRAQAQVPDGLANSRGEDGDDAVGDPARAAKIRNRASEIARTQKLSFNRAWDLAEAEFPR